MDRGEDREARETVVGSDGDRFLNRVATRLQMPGDMEREVLDELRAHMDDARAALEAEGLDADKAEQEAMARLGSPDALGDNLRRTHQTRRRLLAAAGGGIWDGLKDAIAGYIVGIIVVLVAFMVLGSVTQRLFGPLSAVWVTGRGAQTTYTGSLFAIAAWWGARGLIRSMSRRSLRRAAVIRRQIAFAGAVVLSLILVAWPLQYNWAGIAAMLAVPATWAVAAITAPDVGDRRRRWTIGRPSPRVLGVAVILAFCLPIALNQVGVTVNVTSNESGAADEAMARLPDRQHWVARGYTMVTPTAIDLRHSDWEATPFADRNGNVALTLSYDAIDWDDFTDLQVEAWSAVPADVDVRSVDPRATGPYAVIPLNAWDATDAIVPVGSKPGIAAYLLFVTGVDRSTAERVAIGLPDGGDVAFTGTIVDWFSRLGP